jgi:HNH endonuclease
MSVHHADPGQLPIFNWRSETACWYGPPAEYAKGALDQKTVRELLDYDPVTGGLTWRWRDRRWFESDRIWKAWNTRYAGKPAFTALNSGHLHGAIFDKLYLAHRVIFLYMTGSWSDPEVDHDNHDRADNRWTNLIEATTQQNSRNRTLNKNNTNGRIGVRWREDKGKFQAEIKVDYHTLHLGYSETFEAACNARADAERKYGFHEHHGEAC